jgi:uncharacterized protein YfbU (UPF0304 family)
MATITLRLDDQVRDDLEQLARNQGVTLSELLRVTLMRLVGRDADTPPHVPPSLEITQRHTFRLLHKLMAEVGPEDERDYHRRQAEVIEEGFTADYYSVFGGIVFPEMTKTDAELVYDLLDAFTVLESSLDKLDDDARAALGEGAEYALRFRGFDHNDSQELRLAGFAKHLIDDGRWSSMAHHFDEEHEGGNSHMPTLSFYRRVLAAYKAVLQERKRTVSDFEAYRFDAAALREVLAAAR